MTKHITLTIPRDDQEALIAAGEFFLTLAGDRRIEAVSASDGPQLRIPTPLTQPVSPEPDQPLMDIPEPVLIDPESDQALTDIPEPVLDANGLPWDERIHAGTKTKTADGSWKKKRGVDPDVLKEIEQELRDLMSIPLGGEPLTDVPAPVTDVPTSMNYAEFLKAVSQLIIEGKTTLEKVNEACRDKGVQSMHLVGTREDLIPVIWKKING